MLLATPLGLAVVVLCSMLLISRFPDRVLLPGKGAYASSGPLAGQVLANDDVPYVLGKLHLWSLGREQQAGSRSRTSPGREQRHAGAGALTSSLFAAPDVLGLFVAGNYDGADNQVIIQLDGSRHWRALYLNHSSEPWTLVRWQVPTDWRGKKIRVVAQLGEFTPGVWVGVSSPLECSWPGIFAQQVRAHALIPAYLLHFVLFIFPGLLLVYLLGLHRRLDAAFTVLISAALGALLGYGAFWVSFLNHEVGMVFGICAIGLSMVAVVAMLIIRRPFRQLLSKPDVVYPLLLMFLVGLLYMALLLLVESTESTHKLARGRLVTVLHGDNTFPKMFADALYRGFREAVRFGNFLSSDRPPLQSGILLIQRPLMSALGVSTDFHQQVLGSVAQVTWVPAVWAVCRLLGLRALRIVVVLGFCTFSGFFFFNTIHVWPKMLAGSFTVLAVLLVLSPGSHSTVRLIVAGGAAALGMLAHGGSVFPTLVALVLLLWPRRFPGFARLLAGCLVFGALLAPWFAYQKLYDPPGNRLGKWHLGGIKEADDRSTVEALSDAYGQLGAAGVVQHKLANLKALVWRDIRKVDGFRFISAGDTSHIDDLRSKEFLHVFRALGLLNLGWLLLPLGLLFKRLGRGSSPLARSVLLFCLASLLLWTLLMFGPGTTLVFQGSYATMLLLFAGLASYLAGLPRVVALLLLTLQVAYFVTVWIASTPPRPLSDILPVPDLSMIGLALLCLACLVRTCWSLRARNPF